MCRKGKSLMPLGKHQFIVRVKRRGLPGEEVRYVNKIEIYIDRVDIHRNRKMIVFLLTIPFTLNARETSRGVRVLDIEESE